MTVRLAALLISVAWPSLLGDGANALAAVRKTQLQSYDFPSPVFRTITVRTVIDPGNGVKPHTHPGLEMAYIIAGKARLLRANAPVRLLSAGDSFEITQGTVHGVVNAGPTPLTIVSTYVVDKNKPLSSPALANR